MQVFSLSCLLISKKDDNATSIVTQSPLKYCFYYNTNEKTVSNRLQFSTPRVGFEPTTLRLTAECSTAELSRTTFIIINTLHIFCKCFFHFLCTLKTTYKFKSLLHPFFLTLSYLLGYALDRLVTVSSMHYCTSTSALSTSSSSRGLTSYEWDISS